MPTVEPTESFFIKKKQNDKNDDDSHTRLTRIERKKKLIYRQIKKRKKIWVCKWYIMYEAEYMVAQKKKPTERNECSILLKFYKYTRVSTSFLRVQ